jgi:hypothetical protein
MEKEYLPAELDRRESTERIRHLIIELYTRLQQILRSPYVDGNELYEALMALGYGMEAQNPQAVAIALGSKGLGLPVANLCGKPKHYLPSAMPTGAPKSQGLSEQVAAFARTLRTFARC